MKGYSFQELVKLAEAAVRRAGDIMTGDLTAPKVLVSGAQGTEVNALTRRDYVIAELAKKLNLTGGTLTGNLTAPAVLVSSAQNTSVNALTRKDYVDSAIAAAIGGVTPASIGADAAGSANTAVSDHVAHGDPHFQYDYRWLNSTANTGVITGSVRCRWLVDTNTTCNRTIGEYVRDVLVKDITGQASTNNITITAPSGKTINGAATETIDVNYGWVQYVLVGTDFKTIGGR